MSRVACRILRTLSSRCFVRHTWRRFLSAAPIPIFFLLGLAGNVDAQASARPRAAHITNCVECGWTFGEPESIIDIIGSDSLWFGRIGGFAVVPGSEVIFVSDVLQHQVLRIDLGAKSVKRIGRAGEGPGEFRLPTVVAPSVDGSMWVYDALLRRLSHFDSRGTYIRDFTPRFAVIGVVSLAVDIHGYLYLAGNAIGSEVEEFSIHKFSPSGEHLTSFGDAGKQPAALDPRNRGGYVATDSQSASIWFSAAGPALRVTQYSLEGDLLRSIPLDTQADLDAPTQSIEAQGNEIRVAAQRRLGTVSLTKLPNGYLVNTAVVSQDGKIQFDIIDQREGRTEGVWTDAAPLIAGGNGVDAVFSIMFTGEPDILRWSVERAIQQ